MNNKGQAVFVGIMTAIMVFIVTVQLIQPIKTQIETARDVPNLDCGNSSITTATKATCIITDFTLFYYVAVAIAVGAGAITAFGAKKLIK